jgi:hypothetical protein
MRVGRRFRKEDPHASTCNRPSPPPRPTRPQGLLHPNQLWWTLTTEHRAQILNALSRVVAEHLVLPPVSQEVTHERP